MESTTQETQKKHRPSSVKTTRPAGFFSRSVAFIIDLAILSITQLVGSALIGSLLKFFRLAGLAADIKTYLENSTVNLASGAVLTSLLVIVYFTFFWTLVGFTPGKAIMGLKIVEKDGTKISFGRSIVRFLSYWISLIPLGLGFFWVLWDPKRKGWHDKIAGTQVLYVPKFLRK